MYVVIESKEDIICVSEMMHAYINNKLCEKVLLLFDNYKYKHNQIIYYIHFVLENINIYQNLIKVKN